MESLLKAREIYGTVHLSKKFSVNYESQLMDRLGVSNTLEGHEGCVNTLRWNNSGTLLASGSDDRTVRIWGEDGSLKTTYRTAHTFNIFGVEFLPYGEDRIIASGAGDNRVKLHDIELGEELNNWQANSRVKRLATAQDEPYVFWSSSEDGHIRQHDARTNGENCIITAINDEHIKTFAVCQGRTELVAVGISAYIVPIYDRRNPKEPVLIVAAADQVCCPQVARHALYPTHVTFDYYGRELLVNQNGAAAGGTIFLFDIQSNQPSVTMEKLGLILKHGGEERPPGPNVFNQTLAEYRLKAKNLMMSKKYNEAVTVYNEALLHCPDIPNEDRALIYANRGMAYLARRRNGDTYASIRDNIEAVLLDTDNTKALWRLAKGFLLLEQWQIAKELVDLFKERFPGNTSIDRLEKQLEEALKEGKNPEDMLDMRSPLNNCTDYKERYIGHTNLQTDIKEANFFGTDNQYIVAGSDCGSLVIWDRTSGSIKSIFHADDDILNIVQPHPSKFMLASSGIEKVIRFWEPLPEGVEEGRKITEEELLERSEQPRPDMLILMNALVRMQHGLHRDRGGGDDDREGDAAPGCAVQ